MMYLATVLSCSCVIITSLLARRSSADEDFPPQGGEGRYDARTLYVTAGKEPWPSDAELREATCLLKVTANLLLDQDQFKFSLRLSPQLAAIHKQQTTSMTTDDNKGKRDNINGQDTTSSGDKRDAFSSPPTTDGNRRWDDFPSVNLRTIWAPSDPRILTTALTKRILNVSKNLGKISEADVPNNSTSDDKVSLTILPLNLASSTKEFAEIEHFWQVFKRTFVKEFDSDPSQRTKARCLDLDWNYFPCSTSSPHAERFFCENRHSKDWNVTKLLSSLAATVERLRSPTRPPSALTDGDGDVNFVVILAMGSHPRLREALKTAAAMFPTLLAAGNFAWMHPNAFSLADGLRQDGDFESLELMERVGFSTVLAFPTQPFSNAELRKFRLLLKTNSCAPMSSTHRALAFVKTLRTVLREEPGLPETWETWNLFVSGFRNRSATQIIQNSPWLLDEAWTANEAGRRPTTLGSVHTETIDKRRLLGELSSAADVRCADVGSIAVKAVDPFSLDTVKRIYDAPGNFPESAVVPRNHGFAITVGCRDGASSSSATSTTSGETEIACGSQEQLMACFRSAASRKKGEHNGGEGQRRDDAASTTSAIEDNEDIFESSTFSALNNED